MRRVKKVLITILIFSLPTFIGCATKGIYYSKTKDFVRIYNKAERLYKQKRYDKAKDYFQQLITENPESPLVEPSVYYLAECYKKEGKYQRAISFYQAVITKNQSDIWVSLAKKGIEEIKSIQKD